MSARAAHARLRAFAIAILLAGLAAGALICLFAADDRGDALRQVTDSRNYEYNIERIGGMSAVYAARFNAWFASLWHGRTLGVTIGVLAVACALVMLAIARSMRASARAASDAGAGNLEG
jgi:hypothetical protein